jgi:8-oxo-dGTP pyrophosphatase MutT (NUDIX family)
LFDSKGYVLLLRRADTGEWAFPGGVIEDGETSEEAARRECEEEIGRQPDDLKPWTRRVADGVDFTTYLCRVEEQFEPNLNDEHTDHVWERLGDLAGSSLDFLCCVGIVGIWWISAIKWLGRSTKTP